jgi:DNA polymerase-3 subunit beta
MKIRVNRETMMPSLAQVGGVVERRQTLPILGNLLVAASSDTVSVTGTDLEIEVTSRFDANVEAAGDITLPARKFIDICRALPEGSDVALVCEGSRATLSSGKSRFVLSTLPATDYPLMDAGGDEAETIEIAGMVLGDVLEKTAFAMAHQDVRYYLNGLFVRLTNSGITAVATDGHRMAKIEEDIALDIESEHGIILPSKTVVEMKRLLHAEKEIVRLRLGEKLVQGFFGESVLTSKLVDGRYPDYQRVIPILAEKVAIVERDALRQALNRTSILSNDKYKGVKLTFGKGELRLQAHNPEQEIAEDELAVDYDDEVVTIGFNVGYLLDILSVLDEDDVEIRFSGSDSSALVRNKGKENQAYVVMPMRL